MHFYFTVENEIKVKNGSDCYNESIKAIEKWIGSQIKKGAKSFFGDFGYFVSKQFNMTKYMIEKKWSEKKILFHVSVTTTYYSYRLARLRLPSPKHDGSDEKLPEISRCPKNKIGVEDKKVLAQCAFNETQDSKTKLCHGE